jgi:hypothetical protein
VLKGVVQNQNPRPGSQDGGQDNPLLLADRKLERRPAGQRSKVKFVENNPNPLPGRRRVNPKALQRKTYFFKDSIGRPG